MLVTFSRSRILVWAAHAFCFVGRVRVIAAESILRRARIARSVGFSLFIVWARVLQAQDNPLPHLAYSRALEPNRDSTTFHGATWQAWIEVASHAPVSNRAESPQDRFLAIAGLEREYSLLQGPLGLLETSLSFLPAVYTNGNRRQQTISCGTLTLCQVSVRYPSFGVGALPLSLHFMSAAVHGVSLVVGGGAGGVWFTRQIPSETGTRFNFLAQGGADLGLHLPWMCWAFLGFRQVHISNGGFGTVNVGIDAHLFAIGILRR